MFQKIGRVIFKIINVGKKVNKKKISKIGRIILNNSMTGFKKFLESLPIDENKYAIAYHGSRKPFIGQFDLKKLATFEPANLGLFLTDSPAAARYFIKHGGEIMKMHIDLSNAAYFDADGQNLRTLITTIKKVKRKKSVAVISNVIDGIYHNRLYIVFNPNAVITISSELVPPKL